MIKSIIFFFIGAILLVKTFGGQAIGGTVFVYDGGIGLWGLIAGCGFFVVGAIFYLTKERKKK